MDRLDRVLAAAAPLLRRVDELLAAGGAPADHRVWAELRRVRLLPGDAARGVAALSPRELLDAAPDLRGNVRAYGALAASLPGPGEWTGAAAEAYDAARRRAAAHLSGGGESLGARLEASADLADGLVAWMRGARDAVADALARALSSTAAVVLAEGGTDLSTSRELDAAAEVAALVLRAVADGCLAGEALLRDSAGLAEAH
ncbi:hypothetical protein ACFQFC_22170 [Amorphoplanes digitatis]|uniref:Uncharacterized protein n=1 Tax=Actinoplanes digitatis TaxID=1868 RepID=A0A7W7MUS7_9ACTN|nr:hypothetical protein [Actinoplanes digitatis]MBB4766924.1 hypothetical protein [Actinoplanes digitatis]BFE77157.1 hypothetical protein GCM10020092_104580 [Actinoplanes digitatis]GID95460.1 hypothetical protein Adi01nite_48720 [Actinoplanes digitatis]